MKTLFLIIFISCAQTSEGVRSFSSRTYRLCKEHHACYRWCASYKFLSKKKTENCDKWGYHIVDLSKPDNFKLFKDSNFVLIREDRIE